MTLVTARLHALGDHSVSARIRNRIVRNHIVDRAATGSLTEVAVNLVNKRNILKIDADGHQ